MIFNIAQNVMFCLHFKMTITVSLYIYYYHGCRFEYDTEITPEELIKHIISLAESMLNWLLVVCCKLYLYIEWKMNTNIKINNLTLPALLLSAILDPVKHAFSFILWPFLWTFRSLLSWIRFNLTARKQWIKLVSLVLIQWHYLPLYLKVLFLFFFLYILFC